MIIIANSVEWFAVKSIVFHQSDCVQSKSRFCDKNIFQIACRNKDIYTGRIEIGL